jgi:hypothetical protein
MPAINVARTDTFEQQRVKINEIGSQIFAVTSGGSNLATGELRLGDGTLDSPSLSFSNDVSLGLYRPSNGNIGFVYNSKNIFDITPSGIVSYQDLNVQRRTIGLDPADITIVDGGSGYDAGIYQDIILTGGTGTDAKAEFTIYEFVGSSTDGSGYLPGSFTNIALTGGSGFGAALDFTIDSIVGTITQAGSGYDAGSFADVPLANGSGTGAKAAIVQITETAVTVTNGGTGYPDGFYLSLPLTSGSGSGAEADISISGGSINSVSITESGSGYIVSDVLGLSLTPIGGTQSINVKNQNGFFVLNDNSIFNLNLVSGATYEFDQTNPLNDSTPLCIGTTNADISSALGSADGVTYVVNGVTYNTFADYSSNIAPGDTERKVVFAVPATPAVSSLFIFAGANNGISVSLVTASGSSASFEVTSSPGVVDSIFIDATAGVNYVQGDVLTLGGALGASGSGFEFTISNAPGILNQFAFSARGLNYQVGDVLTLPAAVTGVATTLEAPVIGVNATLSSSSYTVTVNSSAGIQPGYEVSAQAGSTAGLVPGTTVVSVVDATTITISSFASPPGSAVLDFTPVNATTLTVADASNITSGSTVTVASGSGVLVPGTTVISASGTTVLISDVPTTRGNVTLDFSPPYGPGTGWSYTISQLGAVGAVTISPTEPGIAYNEGDLLSVSPSDLTQPTTYTVTTVDVQELTLQGVVPLSTSGLSEGDRIEVVGSGGQGTPILKIYTQNGNILSLVTEDGGFQPGDNIIEIGGGPTLTVDTATTGFRFYVDSGSGAVISPDLTLYEGDVYIFDYTDSSNSGHIFSLSEFPDGTFSPSLVENVNTTLFNTSRQISVASTTGVLAGMEVIVTSGSGALQAPTKVESVDSATQITLDTLPTAGGASVVSFRGTELAGTNRGTDTLEVTITSETPRTLYYYCTNHPDVGGGNGREAIITVSANNPKTFGSGFTLRVENINTLDIITNSVSDGVITTQDIQATTGLIADGEITTLASTDSTISNLYTSSIESQNQLLVSSLSGATITTASNIDINSNITIQSTTGNITSSGFFKTTDTVNVSDTTFISNNTIRTEQGSDLLIQPDSLRVAKVDTTTAFVIPVGNTSQRPNVPIAQDGAIRFNTQTNQYEGYSAISQAWSSLGGVRDLDGNTYILAEESIGINDNTLWFINDNINTVKFGPTKLEFVNNKAIHSPVVNAPTFITWTANLPVTAGTYVKWLNNLYEVTVAGSLGTSGNEPTHTTGTQLNGSSELTWYQLAVAPLTFEEIEELRIGPTAPCPLVINSDLRLYDNVVSTDISDIVLKPNSGKKIVCDATSTFAVPVGTTGERGAPVVGSIRFNTTTLQYEGYDNAGNWGSLGGVKDVDQNTYIIPELSPGSNENTLFFFNDNNNTLRLTTTELQFDTVDTIVSSTSDEFEITASLMTFDNAATTLDNTGVATTFLHSSKQNFDLGLSSGLYVEPVLRLDNQGDVYFNTGFGTGIYNGVKVFDGDLKEFELSDIKILSDKITLVKGSVDNGNTILYPLATSLGCKTVIVAHNTNTNEKEFIEFGVSDDGTDVFHTEYGNLRTGNQLIIPTFEVTASNESRLNLSIGPNVSPTETVNITITSTIIKK